MTDWQANRNTPETAEALVEVLDYVQHFYGKAALWHMAVTVLVTRSQQDGVKEHTYVLGDYVVTCRRES
jgi:hypothetical protein